MRFVQECGPGWEGPHHLRNIPGERAFLVEEAERNTGFRVFVKRIAAWVPGDIPPGSAAVWTSEPDSRDHGPFWREYERLRAITAGLPLPRARALLAQGKE